MKARYEVHVPKVPPGLGHAAHHFITYISPMQAENTHLVSGHPHDVLHAYAEDTPENDSHIKQLAKLVGDASGAPSIFAAKNGKTTSTWTIHNHGPSIPPPQQPRSPSEPSLGGLS